MPAKNFHPHHPKTASIFIIISRLGYIWELKNSIHLKFLQVLLKSWTLNIEFNLCVHSNPHIKYVDWFEENKSVIIENTRVAKWQWQTCQSHNLLLLMWKKKSNLFQQPIIYGNFMLVLKWISIKYQIENYKNTWKLIGENGQCMFRFQLNLPQFAFLLLLLLEMNNSSVEINIDTEHT